METYQLCSICLVKRPFWEMIAGYWFHHLGEGKICLDCSDMIAHALNSRYSWRGFCKTNLPQSNSRSFWEVVIAR